MVPKGFIRYQVLESLAEKPMSGSEIINEIENRTNGRWKPSPGSVYPLLAWLQDNGHVKELPADENGLKRYELTASGRNLLEEQKTIVAEQRKRFEDYRKTYQNHQHGGPLGPFPFVPPFMGAPWSTVSPEKAVQMRRTIRRLAEAFISLGDNIEAHGFEETFDEAQKLLNETAQKLEEINKRLGGGKRDE